MSKIKVIDETKPNAKKKLLIRDLASRELFYFIDGYPPNAKYPRIFYMKLVGDSYIQLNGPSAGKVYNGYSLLTGSSGPVKRVHGTLRITHEEEAGGG